MSVGVDGYGARRRAMTGAWPTAEPDGRLVFNKGAPGERWMRPDWPEFCVCYKEEMGDCVHVRATKDYIRSGDIMVDVRNKRSDAGELSRLFRPGVWDQSRLSEYLTRGELTELDKKELFDIIRMDDDKLPAWAFVQILEILVKHPSTQKDTETQVAARERFLEAGGKEQAWELFGSLFFTVVGLGMKANWAVWVDLLENSVEAREREVVRIVKQMPIEDVRQYPKSFLGKLLRVEDKNLRLEVIGLIGSKGLKV